MAIILNVDKDYHFIARAIIISGCPSGVVTPKVDDNDPQTNDYMLENMDGQNYSLQDIEDDAFLFVYKDGEFLLRPELVATYELEDGTPIIDFRAPVGANVICTIKSSDPDNIGYANSIDTIKIKDRLNLLALPGEEIKFDKERKLCKFMFTASQVGVARLRYKDNLFIHSYTADDFRFYQPEGVIESL